MKTIVGRPILATRSHIRECMNDLIPITQNFSVLGIATTNLVMTANFSCFRMPYILILIEILH